MKKIVTLSLAVISIAALTTSSAFAAKEGSYLGLGLGYSKLQTGNNYRFTPNTTTGIGTMTQKRNLGGLGERVFAGYNINQYFGIEAGLAHYASSSYKTTISGFNYTGKADYYLNAFDVVGKGYLPIQDSGFNLYALAGLAYVRSQTQIKETGNANVSTLGLNANNSQSFNNYKVRPKFGVGASYDFPGSQWGTSVEWSRIQGTGNVKTSNKAIPNADMVAFSLTYSIG